MNASRNLPGSPPRSPRFLDTGASSANYRCVQTITEQQRQADEMAAESDKHDSAELASLGKSKNEASHYDEADYYFNRALQKLEGIADPQEKILVRAKCLHGLANGQRERGQDEVAIQGYLESVKEYEKIADKSTKAFLEIEYQVQRDLAIAYLKVGKYQDVVGWCEKAIVTAEKSNEKGRIPSMVSYRGLAFVLANEINKGLVELDRVRELYPKNIREESMDWAAHRYHRGRAYEAIGNDLVAFTEYEESRRLREQIIDRKKIGEIYYHNRMSDTYIGLGQTAFKLKRLPEAKKYFEKAHQCYQALQELIKDKEARSMLAKKAGKMLTILSTIQTNYAAEEKIVVTPRSAMIGALFGTSPRKLARASTPPTDTARHIPTSPLI